MSPAKTASERIRAMRARREALGLARVELWAHPDDHERIKTYAAKLLRKRVKEGKVPPASG